MKDYCCDALRQAVTEGYLYGPISYRLAVTEDGKKYVDIRVLSPAMQGPPQTPRSRKHKPPLMFAYCPFCGKKFEEDV